MFDDLAQECAESSEWPENLLNSACIRSSLCEIHKRLSLQSPRLFIADDQVARVDAMEMLTGKTQFTSRTWKNKYELAMHFNQYLEGKEKDPLIRYLFLNAAHSRAPLNCTRAMFAHICTYHHILPEFTDLVFTFGQKDGDDFNHTRFMCGNGENGGIPELSGSDQQIQIAYKLFAMEKSDFDNEWTTRQTVVYHSLDLTNSRMFWLIVKANGVIKDRIKEVDADRRRHPAGIPTNIQEALEAAFRTHMYVFGWGCEGWRWYITKLEQQAKPNVVKVTAAPLASMETALPMSALIDPKNATEDMPTQIEQAKKRVELLKDFSLGGPQSLTSILAKIDDARAAMTMNIRMSEDLSTYYQDMSDFGKFGEPPTASTANALVQFRWKLKLWGRKLGMECLRAEALAKRVRTHLDMYNVILEAEIREFDKLSSMKAETVTESMHDIAKTTERDTSSMHIITLFTLLFLPGTFLGTFFSTPIFDDPITGGVTTTNAQNEISAVGGSWSFNWRLFWLFLEICIPLMVVTITVWVCYMRYKNRKRKRAERERIESDKEGATV